MSVEVEVEIDEASSIEFACARVDEAELLKQRNGGGALDANIEHNFEIALLLAEAERLTDEVCAETLPAVPAVDAEPPDFCRVRPAILHADHADDITVVSRDPEAARAVITEVAFDDVVDIRAGIVAVRLAFENTFLEQSKNVHVILSFRQDDQNIIEIQIAGGLIGHGST